MIGTLPMYPLRTEGEKLARSCRAVWLAVILEAVRDYRSPYSHLREQAAGFLFGSDQDFPFICELAGVSHLQVRRAANSTEAFYPEWRRYVS